MKHIGIVRKVDILGRIVLPKSLRRRFNLDSGEKFELQVDGDKVLINKYMPRCNLCEDRTEEVKAFKGKYVCNNCLDDIKKM